MNKQSIIIIIIIFFWFFSHQVLKSYVLTLVSGPLRIQIRTIF